MAAQNSEHWAMLQVDKTDAQQGLSRVLMCYLEVWQSPLLV